MILVRRLIVAIAAAVLVFLSVATGILAGSTIGAHPSGHGHQHAQFLSQLKSGAHALHAPADHSAPHHALPVGQFATAADDQQTNRDCAAACLDTIAAKLLPASVLVKAPDASNVMFFPGASEWATVPISSTPAYWPTAPPDDPATGGTGAARVLARHSHMRI
ncbi:MAG: hypothetical protein AB7E80_08330 [Hyphomicrobiaceae bacterium]